MTSAMIWILVAVVVYLLGMLAIGFKYANNSTSEDFYLGGRKLGPIVTAMSTEASDMSAYLLMGVPGLAFFCGVAEAGWHCLAGLDGRRPCAGHLSQLAHRRKAPAPLLRGHQRYNRA